MTDAEYDATITNRATVTSDTTKCFVVWKLRLNTIDQWGNVWINPVKLPCWAVSRCLVLQIDDSLACPTYPGLPLIGLLLFKNTPDVYSAPSFRFDFNFATNSINYYTGDTGLPLTLQQSIPNLSSMWNASRFNVIKICYVTDSTATLSLNNNKIGKFTHFSFPMGYVGLYAPCLKQEPFMELR